jgi:hypothetical protein
VVNSKRKPVSDHAADFHTTHWSLVLLACHNQAPEGQAALAELCGIYWYPLYAHARRRGYDPEDAQDLTQNTTSHSKFDRNSHDRDAVRDSDGINRSGTQTASRYRDPARQSGDPASGTPLSSNCPASEHRGRCAAPNPSGTRRDRERDSERGAATSGFLFPLGAHSLEVQTFSYWPILSPDFLPAS